MILGIVGHEAKKFTSYTEGLAREALYDIIATSKASKVVSGGCHLGGIDVWAIEVAKSLGVPTHEYLPKTRSWADGYKLRNQEIAEASDIVVCVVVRELPPDYEGFIFKYCYHCKTNDHIKSGGCWTVKAAKRLGKAGKLIII